MDATHAIRRGIRVHLAPPFEHRSPGARERVGTSQERSVAGDGRWTDRGGFFGVAALIELHPGLAGPEHARQPMRT